MKLDLKALLSQVENICKKAGEKMTIDRANGFSVSTKTLNNLVTEVDKNVEIFLVEALGEILPGSGFIAEEGTGEKKDDYFNWIIDPLDGTTNFIHNIPAYCVSVALHHHDLGLVIGVVYDPLRKESFGAYKNGGCYINGIKIEQVPSLKMSDALLATGFPYDDFEREDGYFSALKSLTHTTRGLRRLGSAALDLAYVAAGRFGAFFEYGLNPWDVAAGILLVQESGGVCSDFSGNNEMLFNEEIVASHKDIHTNILNTVQVNFQQ
jgi:myo-inositol-1(or 4)-monophosphatase